MSSPLLDPPPNTRTQPSSMTSPPQWSANARERGPRGDLHLEEAAATLVGIYRQHPQRHRSVREQPFKCRPRTDRLHQSSSSRSTHLTMIAGPASVRRPTVVARTNWTWQGGGLPR